MATLPTSSYHNPQSLRHTLSKSADRVSQAQHAKRTQSLTYLPPYQTEVIRAIVREVRDLDKNVLGLFAPFESSSAGFNPSAEPAIACNVLVNHLCMRRDKRCLLAYHRVRAEKLEALVWAGEEVVENSAAASATGTEQENSDGAANHHSLSPEEEEYVRQFGDMLASYKGQWTNIDLTGSLEPPKDLFVDVRVLKDAGEIQTEYGAITLSKNSQFWVRQGDVERLITQGYLQKLS